MMATDPVGNHFWNGSWAVYWQLMDSLPKWFDSTNVYRILTIYKHFAGKQGYKNKYTAHNLRSVCRDWRHFREADMIIQKMCCNNKLWRNNP